MNIWVVLKGLKEDYEDSSWTGKEISHKDCEHVLEVWDIFEMKKMKDYHDLYLKCDVLLLVDVLEKFRKSSLKNS